jgi:hypothetical protein
MMNFKQFTESLTDESPNNNLPAPLAALWWDAKGDWAQAHALVDELETQNGMAVHAYLHRKEGASWNADYWYQRCGSHFRQTTLEAEWKALTEALLAETKSG